MLENNFIDSASFDEVNKILVLDFKDTCFRIFAKIIALGHLLPTTILDGYRLSYRAYPSLKNSGEKIILSVLYLFFRYSVCPSGRVDLITIKAFLLILKISLIVLSTESVLK